MGVSPAPSDRDLSGYRRDGEIPGGRKSRLFVVGSPENEVFRQLASRDSGVDSVSGSTTAGGASELCEPLLMNDDTRLGEVVHHAFE